MSTFRIPAIRVPRSAIVVFATVLAIAVLVFGTLYVAIAFDPATAPQRAVQHEIAVKIQNGVIYHWSGPGYVGDFKPTADGPKAIRIELLASKDGGAGS